MLREANEIATRLGLQEKLPINENDLSLAFADPPELAKELASLGIIETANYGYSFPKGNKLCYVMLKHAEAETDRYFAEYSWPLTLADPNGAYQLATQWLAAACVDVEALNRDCKVSILPRGVKGGGTKKRFTPLYWVAWPRKPKDSGSVALVQLFLPTRRLISLRVEDPRYLLRSPLQVTNGASILLGLDPVDAKSKP
jgi:hypothetical protein